MQTLLIRLRRYLLAALLVLLAAIGARAQAPEFSYWDRTPLPQQGVATYYNPGVMEQVLDSRLAAQDIDACAECVGTVALLRAGDIGRKVWLQPPGGDPVGPFLVIDCARRQDVEPLLDRNWIVDVSYEVGQYWGMNRPLDGVIVFEDPADIVSGRQVNRIPTPFSVSPEDVVISVPTATPFAPVAEAIPTSWPTRMPVSLVPQLIDAPEFPTATRIPPTPTAIWPPPLTPIVTTPTPAATPTATFDGSDMGQARASPAPSPTPTEVSIGRAGGGLLAHLDAPPTSLDAVVPGAGEPDAAPTPTKPAPTARPTLARTPRPNLTPILPLIATPAATSTPDAGLIDRLLKGLLDLVR